MKSGGNLGASPKFGWLDPMPPIENATVRGNDKSPGEGVVKAKAISLGSPY